MPPEFLLSYLHIVLQQSRSRLVLWIIPIPAHTNVNLV